MVVDSLSMSNYKAECIGKTDVKWCNRPLPLFPQFPSHTYILPRWRHTSWQWRQCCWWLWQGKPLPSPLALHPCDALDSPYDRNWEQQEKRRRGRRREDDSDKHSRSLVLRPLLILLAQICYTFPYNVIITVCIIFGARCTFLYQHHTHTWPTCLLQHHHPNQISRTLLRRCHAPIYPPLCCLLSLLEQ